jgi:hypothetical protein
MIRLIDLLKLQGAALENETFKIHLATHGTWPPLDAYLAGTFKEWQEDQTKKNFECRLILSLIHLGGDRWLFAGVYQVDGVQPGQATAFKYETRLLPGHEELIGRVVVKYKREYRASYIWGDKYGAQLEVGEILASPMTIEKFPGYNKIRISHDRLVLLFSKAEPSWMSALSSVGGVYLIKDIRTGKGYIGCAIGQGGLWQRWRAYAETGHGGNDELRDLLDHESGDYRVNFQYSVLEIADLQTQIEQICARENYWKEILMSRVPFGYNAN